MTGYVVNKKTCALFISENITINVMLQYISNFILKINMYKNNLYFKLLECRATQILSNPQGFG